MPRATAIDVQKYLKGMDYPATKEDIMQKAEEEGADDDVRQAIESLPDDDEFETPAAVSKALGGQVH